MIRNILFILLIGAFATAQAGFEEDLSASGNAPKTVQELRARAEAGDAEAQLNIGGLFFKGEGVKQDYAEALKWFLLAARQGQIHAQFNLGMMYDSGQGVTQNQGEAAQWYRAAARRGFALAQLNLGVAYATGQGVLKNEAEAARWTRMAAEQGEVQAQFNLAVMYANGQGVKQDFVEAYRWAKAATDRGHAVAPSLLADLTRQMTPAQIASATHPAVPPEPASNTAGTRIYLQLGAFKSKAEADAFCAEMRTKLGDLEIPIAVYENNGWIRIHAGPYHGTREAHRSAKSIKAVLGYEPLLKQH